VKSSEFEDIIRNEKLCLDSEDTLFDFLVESGSYYLNLIDHVRLEFFSPESIDRFFNMISYSMSMNHSGQTFVVVLIINLFTTQMRFL
jgi:hypothetical protein